MSLLREPLVHFAALGALLFAAFFALGGYDSAPGNQLPRITVDAAQQAVLAEQFTRVWRRAPTDEERARLIEDFIESQVLVREARALGLEQGDPIVDQRLRQKITFLISGIGLAEPTDAELRAAYEAQAERYTADALLAFRQVPLDETAPVEAEITRISGALSAGADPASLSPASLLPTEIALRPSAQIDRQFGKGVAAQIAALPDGDWSGPVRSGYGWHLVQRTALVPERVLPFEEVADQVRADWDEQQSKTHLAERIAQMRARYVIEVAPMDTTE